METSSISPRVQYALVDPLIMSAEDHELVLACELLDHRLIQHPPRGDI